MGLITDFKFKYMYGKPQLVRKGNSRCFVFDESHIEIVKQTVLELDEFEAEDCVREKRNSNTRSKRCIRI